MCGKIRLRVLNLPISIHGVSLGLMGLYGLWKKSESAFGFDWLRQPASILPYISLFFLGTRAMQVFLSPKIVYSELTTYPFSFSHAVANMALHSALLSVIELFLSFQVSNLSVDSRCWTSHLKHLMS